jgi:hypothetical protein
VIKISHYTVLVIGEDVDWQLAKYDENKKVYFPEKEEIECECGKVFEGFPDKEDTCPECLKKLIQGEN